MKEMQNISSEIISYWNTQPDSGRALISDVDDMIKFIGKNLPETYKKYLMEIGYKKTKFQNKKYKGDVALAGIDVKYDISGALVEKQEIFDFYCSFMSAISNTKSYANPMQLYDDIGPRIPPEMIIVGEISNGYALLDLSDKNYGRIWFWDRVDETWGTEENNTIGYMGSDVFDVLSRLYPVEI